MSPAEAGTQTHPVPSNPPPPMAFLGWNFIAKFLMTKRNVGQKLIKFIVILFIEFHPPQLIATQSVHAGAERGNRQVLLVDAQPGRETGQVGA